MGRLDSKKANRARRINRVRSVVTGTAKQPRLVVNVSNYNVSAQLVDDATSTTLAAASSVGAKVEGNLSVKAAWVGTEIAARAKTAKIKHVSFDRRGKKYHGRVKTLAEAARKGGLEF